MASIRNGNTYYIDDTTALTAANVKVTKITVTATSANAILNLQDVTTGANKINLRVATSGTTEVFDFSDDPLLFPNGISPNTVTNCNATCVISEARG